ncbi:MAG: preprotein translocase subunit YajC [Planctomycetota bacterium]
MIDRMVWTVTLAQDAPPGAGVDSGADAPPPAAGVDSVQAVDGAGDGTTAAPLGSGSGSQPGGLFGGSSFLILMIGMIVVMYVVVFGGQRREKKRKAEMLDGMQKGDRIQTVGGVLGTVLEVKEHEVVLKVDENANTRMRFAKSAVQTVLERSD